MALESEPQSTPLGGSDLDALKSESCDVDLEDGEIEDDDVPEQSANPTASTPIPTTDSPRSAATNSSTSTPLTPKNHSFRESNEDSTSWTPRKASRNKSPNLGKQKRGSKGAWGHSNNKSFENDEGDDDDWANNLEKALKAAIKDKTIDNADEAVADDDDDRWNKRRKKRKKHGDEDEERKNKHGKKARYGDSEDDDMQLFVRGASPLNQEMDESSPYGYDMYNEDEDEEEEYDESPDRGSSQGGFLIRPRKRGSKPGRGRGSGSRRGGNSGDGGRGAFGKRGKQRAGRGGTMGKPQRGQRDRSQDNICQYFMQGKCSKGPDECPYSHDAMPPRKMELCKFYLMDCCAKREKCLYMHHDFPCKFYHTGLKCKDGERNCKFSHGKLTDGTKSVLLKHLETAPKEILGEFPRLSRENANKMIIAATKARAQGMEPIIDPSLTKEEGGYKSDEDRPPTPMPTSPYDSMLCDQDKESNSRRSREESENHGGGRRREHTRESRRDRDHHGDKRDRRRKRRWDSPDNSPMPRHSQKDSKNVKGEKSHGDRDGLWGDRKDSKDDRLRRDKSNERSNTKKEEKSDKKENNENNSPNSKSQLVADSDKQQTKNDSDDESQDSTGANLSHLPKRQRELFLRIQQQQREAEHSQESKPEDAEDEAQQEDDWYSSDEDGAPPLSDVLKNLPKSQEQKSEEKTIVADKEEKSEVSKTEIKPARRPPLLPTPVLTDLMNSSAIDQLLSSIRYGKPQQNASQNFSSQPALTSQADSSRSFQENETSAPTTTTFNASSNIQVRDPRLCRDPRSRNAAGGTPPPHDPTAQNVPEPRSDPRLERKDPRTEPRQDPRTETRTDPRMESRVDPRTESRSERRDPRMERHDFRQSPPDVMTSPRSEIRPAPADPRAARMEVRRSSGGSGSSTSSNSNILPQRSIYDAASLPGMSGAGDIDLRIMNSKTEILGDTDFRTRLGAGDMDMRRQVLHPFSCEDTDLRFGMGNPNPSMDLEGDFSSRNDMDLRRMQLMLPFKPAPVHTAATEINASLSSYTPRPYKVVPIDIPRPDFSSLSRIPPHDPQIKMDPRLRRLFPEDATSCAGLASPVSETPALASSIAPPVDPRRRNSATIQRPADPRQGRMGFCPPTPRIDEYDDHMGALDVDLRTHMYGQPWEGARGPGLLPHPEPSTWMQSGRPLHPQYHPKRPYSPPPR